MRIFIFLHFVAVFVFLYFLNSLLPYFFVAEVLSSFFFAKCCNGSLLFANCRNKSFFKWSHQINFFCFFFFFKLLQRLQHQITCIWKLLYNLTLLTGGLNWPFIYFDQAESTDYVVQMMCMCTARGHVSCRRGREGYIGPHIMWQETHESHHQVNTKHVYPAGNTKKHRQGTLFHTK